MILVTGGAGFIGSHLVDQLARAGECVRVLDLPNRSVDHLPAEVEIVRGDIRDVESVRRAVQDCRIVYHLAANPNLWTRRRADFHDVNYQGTVHVLNEALGAGAERVLYVSTESILTSESFRGGAVETLELRRADMVGPYCLSKFLAEEEAFRLARKGKPVLIASPTLPIGPGDRGMSPPTRMTVAALRGELPAYLDCRFNLIDARDVAAGLIRVIERGVVNRRYLLGHENVELRDWLRIVSHAVGRSPPRWKVPYPIALAAAYASERWSDFVSHKMPQATVTGVRLTRHTMHFDPSATLAELDMHPRSITESLADAIAWYREEKWI